MAIDELTDQHQKANEEKGHETDYLRKNIQVVLVGKEMGGYLGELSKNKEAKKSKKITKLDDEHVIVIANI